MVSMYRWALFFVSFFWGISFIFIKPYLTVIHPLVFTAWSFLLSAGLFFLLSRGWSKETWSFRLHEGVILGILMFCLQAPQMVGLSETSAANTAFITSFGILLIPLAERVLYRKMVTSHTWGALLVACLGLYYLTGGVIGFGRGDMWVFFAAIGCMLYMVYSDHCEKEKRSDFLVLCTQQSLTAGFLSLCVLAVFGVPLPIPSSAIIFPIVFLAIPFFFVPFLLIQWAERYASEVEITFYSILEPVIGGLAAWTIGHESPTLAMIVGGVLVVGSLIISEVRKFTVLPVISEK